MRISRSPSSHAQQSRRLSSIGPQDMPPTGRKLLLRMFGIERNQLGQLTDCAFLQILQIANQLESKVGTWNY